MSSKSNGHQTSAVGPGRKQHSQNSPTVHLTPGEVVSIDGDYLPQSRPRPPSMMMMSNGSSVSSTPDTTMNLAWQQQQSNNRPGGQRSGPTDGRDRPWSNAEQPQQPQPPQSPLSETSMRSDGRPSDSEAPTYTSQTSLDTDAPGFSRDQFGRQSMSEKRHASLDAKNTDTYQRNKKLREERERQKQTESEQPTSASKENLPPSDKPLDNGRPLFVRPVDLPRASSRDIGPTLGLKKSSSLESLQTVVQEIQMQEEEPQIGCYGYHRPTAIRVVRGRGCNESFRAAVDRSYDESGQPTDGHNKEPMETLDEAAEVEANEMIPPPRSPSEIGIPILNNKSETRKSKKKNANAAGLLLKGLGSMFRFGKHRKSAPASPESGHQSSGSDPAVSGHSMAGGNMIMPSSGNQQQQQHHHHHQSERRSSGHSGSIGRSSEVDRHHVLRRTLPPDERDRAELGRQMAVAVARQAAQEEQKRIQHHYLRLMDQQQRQAAAHEQQKQQQQQSGATTGDSTNRSQRLHQLRAQHQKRHAEQQRQSTHTPTEQLESNNKNMVEIAHGRSASYDPYNDVRKPRSRAAVGEPNTLMPIPTVSSMYNNNYDEFQLNRRQQHYHSQRSARETRMSPPGGNAWSGSERPVSNYFEYESLHIAGHKVALSGPPYKPQQHQQQQQQQGQQSSNRRPPTMQGDEGPAFFRRPDRNSTGLEYGSNQVRSSQRESVYGASNYGSQNNPSRPAPLTGSKV